jgi:hypothetical protein
MTSALATIRTKTSWVLTTRVAMIIAAVVLGWCSSRLLTYRYATFDLINDLRVVREEIESGTPHPKDMAATLVYAGRIFQGVSTSVAQIGFWLLVLTVVMAGIAAADSQSPRAVRVGLVVYVVYCVLVGLGTVP